MYLLGLDVGTTGCKAVIFDPAGRILGKGFQDYPIETDRTGRAEQDAEAVWEKVKLVIRQAAAGSGRPEEIRAMSLSVQGDAIIPVDGRFRALRRAVLGMDYRSAPQAEACAALLGDRELFSLTGMRPHPLNSLTKILFLREQEPELFAKTSRIVTYADFILGKLGAPPLIDHTMASRTMAFDLKNRVWSDAVLGPLNLDSTLLSRAVPSGTEAGTVSPAVADELGLPRSLRLFTGGHDQPCCALGSGIVSPGTGVVTTGTAEVFSTVSDRPFLSDAVYEGYYPCTLGILPEQYFTFSLNHVGGLLYRWFKENFCGEDLPAARDRETDIYAYLNSRLPEDPTDLLFLPHLNGSGTPWCDPDSRGAVAGMTLNTTRYDIIKAIMESQSFELALNLEQLESAGLAISAIRATGGGARSPEWLQIKADILNQPIQTLENPESGCLGAAVIAGTGAGLFSSFREGAEQLVRIREVREPRPAFVEIYREKSLAYRQLYPALKPVFRTLNQAGKRIV